MLYNIHKFFIFALTSSHQSYHMICRVRLHRTALIILQNPLQTMSSMNTALWCSVRCHEVIFEALEALQHLEDAAMTS